MVEPQEYTAVAVRGWLVDWVRSLNDVRCALVTASEQLRRGVPDGARLKVEPLLRQRLDLEIAQHALEHNGMVLATSEIQVMSGRDHITLRQRFLWCRRAPVPPVEEWGRFEP